MENNSDSLVLNFTWKIIQIPCFKFCRSGPRRSDERQILAAHQPVHHAVGVRALDFGGPVRVPAEPLPLFRILHRERRPGGDGTFAALQQQRNGESSSINGKQLINKVDIMLVDYNRVVTTANFLSECVDFS